MNVKKNIRRKNQSALTLRREHIRILTPVELEQVAGGSPKPTGTVGETMRFGATCN